MYENTENSQNSLYMKYIFYILVAIFFLIGGIAIYCFFFKNNNNPISVENEYSYVLGNTCKGIEL